MMALETALTSAAGRASRSTLWPLFSMVVLCSVGFGALAADYDPLDPNRVIEERDDPNSMMSESVYKRLSSVHEAMGEGDYEAALKALDNLQGRNLNEYERALVLQTFGFVYAQQNEEGKAIQAFEDCLALDALPTSAQQGMRYSLASLYAGEERWQDAIDEMTTWFRYEAEPKADPYVLVGTSYAQKEDLLSALPYVKRAIELSDKPKESWYLLELSIYFEEKQYANAVEALKTIVVLWPEKAKYWEMLSGAYMEMRNDQEALATLMLAYKNGLVTEEEKIMQVVRMNMFLEIPYAAGVILETEMERGRLERTEKNLDLMLSAWTGSREFDKAIATIDELAPLKEDGELYMQKAMLFNELGEWDRVAESAQQAVDKGGLRRPGDAWVLLGMALAELQRFDDALAAFAEARKIGSDGARRNAGAWIDFVNDRKAARS
jgi:tetratricopeptide (TPR) repeat protein